MTKLYYTPPTNEQFNELKEKAIEVWKKYDNKHGYVDEKVNSIKDIQNVGDNFMYILSMYDIFNQKKVISKLSNETKKAIRIRMIDGGNDESYLQMVGL